MGKTFNYGGFTFEPAGQFKDYGIMPGKREMVNITSALFYPNNGYVADGDTAFDYDEFYKAAGGCEDDVFLCKENGERYVPCARCLPVFDQASSYNEVYERYERRCVEREEQERMKKREELKNAMLPTEEGWEDFKRLCEAFKKCKESGFQFAYDGDGLYAFRTDLLKDITTNMVPQNGQEDITGLHRLYQISSCVYDAHEGLYANVKE